jgi:chromosome segregation ATPase
MSESDTPRTDELDDKLVDLSPNPETDYSLMKSHARKLERELTAARAEIEEYAEDKSRLATMAMEFREQRDRAWQTIAEIKRDIMEDETFGDVVIKLWQEPLDEAIEQRDRLAEALQECREDSVELLGERDWWQNEPRCDYQKRYQETRDNVTRADEALQSLTPTILPLAANKTNMKNQNNSESQLSSDALLGMGMFVVEIRTRRKDKTLNAWFPIAAFVKHDMAEDFHEQYAEIGYARILLPNKEDQERKSPVSECSH